MHDIYVVLKWVLFAKHEMPIPNLSFCIKKVKKKRCLTISRYINLPLSRIVDAKINEISNHVEYFIYIC